MNAVISLDLDRVHLPDGLILRDTELAAAVGGDTLSIKKCRTTYGESVIDAKGDLEFLRSQPAAPYVLFADVSIADFDVGQFLKQTAPDQEPALEALVNLRAELSSQAALPEELFDAIAGDVSISAKQGIFRALRRGAVSDVIETVSLLGQLGGMLTGQQDVEAVAQLTTYFNAIAFDNLEIVARRNADLSIDVLNFLLSNPDLMLAGQGSIGNQPNREFYEQPIELLLNIGTKPPVRHLFERLKLLEMFAEDEEAPGADEYWNLRRKVELRGSITKPDPSEFWKRILEAGARRLIDRQREEGESSRDATIREIRGVLGF